MSIHFLFGEGFWSGSKVWVFLVRPLEEDGACSNRASPSSNGFSGSGCVWEAGWGEDVYNAVGGVGAGGGPLEQTVFLEQVRKWFDYRERDRCSMVVRSPSMLELLALF